MFVKYLSFAKIDFQNPKPVGTLERILQMSSHKNSIILDSFAGSDNCLLDRDYMLKKNIIFKKIPRDIKRF